VGRQVLTRQAGHEVDAERKIDVELAQALDQPIVICGFLASADLLADHRIQSLDTERDAVEAAFDAVWAPESQSCTLSCEFARAITRSR